MDDRGVLDVSGRGRVDDRGMLDVSGRGMLRSAHEHSTGVSERGRVDDRGMLVHSELVGARDGYRNMKLFGQNKSRTTHEAHPVKY